MGRKSVASLQGGDITMRSALEATAELREKVSTIAAHFNGNAMNFFFLNQFRITKIRF